MENINENKVGIKELLNNFLDSIYDEKDDFLDSFFEKQVDESNENVTEKENLSEEESEFNSLKYTKEGLKLKLRNKHLYSEPYKNIDIEDLFKDEDIEIL